MFVAICYRSHSKLMYCLISEADYYINYSSLKAVMDK